MFLARSRNKAVVLVREWSSIAVIVMCYFGFVSVVVEWGTASPRSISPVAGILGILAAANVLATGQNGVFVPLLQDRGPASKIKSNGLERPVSVRFNPAGDALYVVDFGVLLMDETSLIEIWRPRVLGPFTSTSFGLQVC